MTAYFEQCKTAEEAKKLYRELVKKHHPDAGGNTATMQEINDQFAKFKPTPAAEVPRYKKPGREATPEQKAKAEERRQKLRKLWEKVSEMTEEQCAAFVDKTGVIVTCEGHPLSVGNTILLAYQADNVTVIGGFQQWQKVGRQVRKGEKALGIWIPAKSREEGEKNEDKKPYFFFGSVFDISQTDPIPEKLRT